MALPSMIASFWQQKGVPEQERLFGLIGGNLLQPVQINKPAGTSCWAEH